MIALKHESLYVHLDIQVLLEIPSTTHDTVALPHTKGQTPLLLHDMISYVRETICWRQQQQLGH